MAERTITSQLRWPAALLVAASFLFFAIRLRAQNSPPQSTNAARFAPWMSRVEAMRANAIPGEAMDEALSGKTLMGTPVTPRIPECFPAEPRDLFWQMDMVPDKDGKLRPLNFDIDGDGKISDVERNAIRGRNTWIMWCCGNEGFWNWLSQDGYGITDFLVLLDSRNRANRFKQAGLINQPGFRSNTDPNKTILGLYLDLPVGDETKNSDLPEGYYSKGHILTPPPWDESAKQVLRPPNHPKVDLFQPGNEVEYSNILYKLNQMSDGVDYTVYGFPSGVVGLRLFPNPDFFGPGRRPERARAYWKERVENSNGAYYTNTAINMDPKLVRPFRVGMSCGFCHVGPHPLNPPLDPEEPDWANLSATIGNQYWKPQPAFAVLLTSNKFLYHFLASQQPGTVDTSLVSSDHINNANTINAVFELNARLDRAEHNPEEQQSPENVLIRSIEDPGKGPNRDGSDWRHTPRVLVDGSDSIGAFGALARVYLNIGTFFEEWSLCHNPIIGFRPQRPFRIDVCQSNSVYWQVNERYRTPYLAAYFTMKYGTNGASPVAAPNPPCTAPHNSTQSMKLVMAKDGDGSTPSFAGQEALKLYSADQRKKGRLVWLDNCVICHSSKQPDGFALNFERKQNGAPWDTQPVPTNATYTLPMDSSDWIAFKHSPAYADYKKRIHDLVASVGSLDGDPVSDNHPFWRENYLSTDIRVPLTLVGTPSGRAMASNGLKDHVWDNFSSITYKGLPAVGAIDYFDPISATETSFNAPGGGRGYYRPATHVSLWATAPYLHNNALGVYLDDPSVKGRLVQYFDGIRRILWTSKRASRSLVLSGKELAWLQNVQSAERNLAKAIYIDPNMVVGRPGDLRGILGGAASKDAGFIYRVPEDTYIEFAPGFIRPLIQGVAGPVITEFLAWGLWVILVPLFAWLAWSKTPRYLGVVLLALGFLVPLPLALTGVGERGCALSILLMGLATLLPFTLWGWRVLALTLAISGILCIQAKADSPPNARRILVVLFVGIASSLLVSHMILGAVAALAVLAILGNWRLWWKNWSLPAWSRAFFTVLTVVTIVLGVVAHQFINGLPPNPLSFVPVAQTPLPIHVGPVPAGTPVNLMMNIDPESPKLSSALASVTIALAEIRYQGLTNDAAWLLFSQCAGQALMDASKCPDFVLDRGHLFGETLDADAQKNDEDKENLIAFLMTL